VGSRYTEVKQELAAFEALVEEKKKEYVGRASEHIRTERIPGERGGSATWRNGNDVAAIKGKAFQNTLQGGCFTLLNAGGIRAGFTPGDITYNDVQVITPFANTVIELSMTGQQFKDVIEGVLHRIKEFPDRSGAFPYGWGFRYEVDLTQARGSLVQKLEVNCKMAGDWVPMDMGMTYKVATSSYLAAGKDGYTLLGDRDAIPDRVETGLLDLDVLLRYVREVNERGQTLTKFPIEEYALQRYVDKNGCDHNAVAYNSCPLFGERLLTTSVVV